MADQWLSSGLLVLEDLSVTYFANNNNNNNNESDWALQGISLRIEAGERVAVCGHTGSGKSTLLLSILALVNASNERITLDGIDISQISKSTLRSWLLVISQDPYVEGDTIRAAVDPESCASSDRVVVRILQECGLWSKINALSGGLDVKLCDLSLSSGEMQLFILARTLVGAEGRSKGGLLLLDEATSSIDTATEQRIMACIRGQLPSMTVISILHRLEAAMEFDRIIALEHRRLVCIGTPADVICDSELFSSFRKAS